MRYVVSVVPDDGAFMVTCTDVPEFLSSGDTEAEALDHAGDALETALMIYIEDGRPIPLPDKAGRDDITVRLPALASAKALLHNEVLRQGISKAELKRRLGITSAQVERLLDMRHATRLDALEEAFKAVGMDLEVMANERPQ